MHFTLNAPLEHGNKNDVSNVIKEHKSKRVNIIIIFKLKFFLKLISLT